LAVVGGFGLLPVIKWQVFRKAELASGERD
jgi:hypothetical protein